MKRKIISLLLLILLYNFSFESTKVIAGDTFELGYWYSDADEIYYWPTTNNNSTLSIFYQTSSSSSYLTLSKIKSHASVAFSSTGWSKYTNLKSKTVTDYTIADIIFVAINDEETYLCGFDDETLGYSDATTSYVMEGSYNGISKDIYSIENVVVYLLDQEEYNLSSSDWTKIACHELGHAFGYMGHTSKGNLMKHSFEDITSTKPNTYEGNHIKQIY